MTIDFHDPSNRQTYATREADRTWASAMTTIMDPEGLRVADIGCGGGIYSRAWMALGAASVIGADSSQQMVSDAREAGIIWPRLSFIRADASDTGLPDSSVDVVFERALIHHAQDLATTFAEAYRILAPGGLLIVQDRTYEDVLQPATPQHLRGYFFESFPRLLSIEQERRPTQETITQILSLTGFAAPDTRSLKETRRTYTCLEEIQDDLRARTGRSILHALSDRELEHLIRSISTRIETELPINEHDFWTLWIANKPLG